MQSYKKNSIRKTPDAPNEEIYEAHSHAAKAISDLSVPPRRGLTTETPESLKKTFGCIVRGYFLRTRSI